MFLTASILAFSLFPVAVFGGGSASFSYDPSSPVGPANWASVVLPNQTNECGGSMQSGINVPTGPCDETNADYVFEAGTCTLDDLTYELYPHVIQLNFNTSSGCTPPSMTIPGYNKTYEALQFHIHAGSDHALDDTYFGLDMHIVHKEKDGDELAVLGLFLEAGNDVSEGALADLIPGWDTIASATLEKCSSNSSTVSTNGARNRRNLKARNLQGSFNPYALVAKDATFYNYPGSLTTPPCSEGINWNVVDTPVSLSVREFVAITNFILDYVEPETCTFNASIAAPSGYTSRPVQPLNGRNITHKCPTGTESQFDEATTSSAVGYKRVAAAASILSVMAAALVM